MNPANQKKREWSHDHFTAFLLMYAAYADYVYDQSEREVILEYVPLSVLKESEDHFEKIGDFEQLQLIMELKEKYVKSSVDEELVKAMLNKLFRSDGNYSRAETYLNNFLERILNLKDP